MTNEEAKTVIDGFTTKVIAVNLDEAYEAGEAIVIAMKALEKQIPKRPAAVDA